MRTVFAVLFNTDLWNRLYAYYRSLVFVCPFEVRKPQILYSET